MKGHSFSIAAGDEYETFMKVKKAFNNRDADAIWKYSADTVAYHVSGGGTVPLTRDYMADFFGSVDSLKWEMNSVLPVKITNSDRVEMLVDSRETLYHKDGTIDTNRLFERFVFKNNIIAAVYQWTAEVGNAE